MGMDPATLAIAGSSIFGALGADSAAKTGANAANKRQDYLSNLGESMLVQPGGSPAIGQLQELLKSINFKGMATPNINASTVDPSKVTPNLNLGNDALMQVLRGDPMSHMDPVGTAFLHDTVKSGGNPFDTSELFSALGTVDKRNIDQQINDLIATSTGGGLGERYGTAIADRGARLRTNALADIGARNAGIAQGSYEAAQGRATGAANSLNADALSMLGLRTQAGGMLNQGELSKMQLLASIFQGNQSAENAASTNNASNAINVGQANNSQQNAVWQQIFQTIMGGQGVLQGDRNNNLAILQALSGMGSPATAGASELPGAIGDLGWLLKMLPLIGGIGKTGGTSSGGGVTTGESKGKVGG